MQSSHALVVVLGTGGTIAGTSSTPDDSTPYQAAQIGIADLLRSVPALEGTQLESEQVAQIDSKDMDHAVWRRLVERVVFHLKRPEVDGIVITHGSDTLEETAFLLQRVLAPHKPVVLTAAMRPASSIQADGPQNLLDAIGVAREPGVQGVLAVLAGVVHGARDVRKMHTSRIDAFGSGDAGPLARIEGGHLRVLRPWPQGEPLRLNWPAEGEAWPRVEIVTSHAGMDGWLVDAAAAQGVLGIVVAGTGNGTLHHLLRDALLRARDHGVSIVRCSRVPTGSVLPQEGDLFSAGGDLSPAKARIDLMLQLMRAD